MNFGDVFNWMIKSTHDPEVGGYEIRPSGGDPRNMRAAWKMGDYWWMSEDVCEWQYVDVKAFDTSKRLIYEIHNVDPNALCGRVSLPREPLCNRVRFTQRSLSLAAFTQGSRQLGD